MLIASLESTTAVSGLVACLQENLGAALAQVVVSGIIPLTESESAVLGECLVSTTTEGTGTGGDGGVEDCLDRELGAETARVVASMALPLTAEQEAVMGKCALEGNASSNQTLSQTLFGGVIACLEQELGEESARVVANDSETLTATQQAALGGCFVGSALGGYVTEDTSENPGSDFSSAVVACLEKELGVDLANVVVWGVVPLNAGEQAVLGRCLLEDAIKGGSSAAIRPEWESVTITPVPSTASGRQTPCGSRG